MLTTENFILLRESVYKFKKHNTIIMLGKYHNIKNILHAHRSEIERDHRSNAPDWNVFRVMGMERYEVTFHTPFLSELLSPHGTHGQGRLFLEYFLRMVGSFSEDEITHPNWYVWREMESIDLRIANDLLQKAVFIENKIDTDAHSGQLSRYYVLWRKSYPKGGVFVYLTIAGVKPPDSGFDPSLPPTRIEIETNLKLLSYKIDIKTWLETIIDSNIIKPEKLKQSVIQYIETINNL
jgi:hypothetical protein